MHTLSGSNILKVPFKQRIKIINRNFQTKTQRPNPDNGFVNVKNGRISNKWITIH